MDEPYIPEPPAHLLSQEERDAWSTGYLDALEGRPMDQELISLQHPHAYDSGYWTGNTARIQQIKATLMTPTPYDDRGDDDDRYHEDESQ